MHTFFHGWRRKAGVVTLVIALALTAVWLRGLLLVDTLYLHHNDIGQWYLQSTNGELILEWERFFVVIPQPSFWSSISRGNPQWDDIGRRGIRWAWNWTGFRYLGDEESFVITLPVWCFVLPLTMLSIYLILWKLRKQELSSPN
ncbi:MAG TPA: hypothetical protein VGM98_15265 [Schlesneria sp.]|jgi:hypothetical protein